MKCFVASALNKTDVDAIYDRCVRPTLKRLSVQPLRVDRVEHIEDIDNKIFQFLDEADFAIVDLTYARPSAYYEAGYAVGQDKPVIYLARSDHFRARDDDPEGLLRVHFDLQMKNIISWSKPNNAFSKRLEKQVRYVLRRVLSQRQREERRNDERSRFEGLPQDLKLDRLAARALALLRARSFSMPKDSVRATGRRVDPLRTGFSASRTSGQRRQQVGVFCTPSAPKRQFDNIARFRWMDERLSRGSPPLQLHYVIVSLRPVPRARVTDALSSFTPLDDGALYCKDRSIDAPDVDVFVHTLGDVKSESEFTSAFKSLLQRHRLSP